MSVDTLKRLRWDVDFLVDNHFGEIVWLKEYFNSDGKRVGITDCCFEDQPCEWHKSISKAKESNSLFEGNKDHVS